MPIPVAWPAKISRAADVEPALPPEFVAWSAAVLGGHPVAELTATVTEFPDLTVPSPLVLTTDKDGWYRLTLVDRLTGASHTGYLLRHWARDRGRRGVGHYTLADHPPQVIAAEQA